MKLSFFSKTRGFTLIELMVVIAIIGVLASIITVSLTSARAKGRDAKRVADIRTIQLALEEYYNDNGNYPANLNNTIAPTYIAVVPTDPNSSAGNSISYFYSSYNAAGGSNCVAANSKPVKYHLAAAMESTAATNPALTQDADWTSNGTTACYTGNTPDFHGLAPLCDYSQSAGSLSNDNCYDTTN